MKIIANSGSPDWFVIKHDDGTRALYAHLKKGGSKVVLGEVVRQGEVLGMSGMVGATLNPHLHFQVISADGRRTIPISCCQL